MRLRSQESVCLLGACLAAGIACALPHASGEAPPNELTPRTEWEARIETALDAREDWALEDIPLSDLCDLVQAKLGIDVVLDVKALEDQGIDPSTRVSRSLRGISNRSFLRWVLNDLDLTYTTHLGALWITTPECSEAQLTIKVYPVGDLLSHDTAYGGAVQDYSMLAQAIEGNLAPESWDNVGGPGAIEGIHGSIVVLQTADVHEQIERFLATYRAIIASDNGAEEPQQTAFMLHAEMNSAVQAALDKPLTAEFKDASLEDVVDAIAATMEIPMLIDARGLEDFEIDPSTPISRKFTNMPLRLALGRLLHELQLTYTVRDEVLYITTPEEGEAQQAIRLYPVRDLVEVGDETSIEPLGARCDFDSLINLLQSTVAPDTWDSVGGPSSIGTLLPVPTIVIAQTQQVHDEISELLTRLRAAKKLEADRAVPPEAADPAALILRSYPIYAAAHSPDELAKLVMRAAEPGSWDDAAGTFVQGFGTTLVVKHNASGHRQVQKLLSQLGVIYPAPFKGQVGNQGFHGRVPGPAPAAQPGASSGGGFF